MQAPARTATLWVVGLIAAAVLLAGGATFVGYRLVDTGNDPDPGADPGPAADSSAPSTAEPGADGWRDAARRYGVAFTDTSGGQVAWLERLEPLVGPALAEGYAYTDLSLVPDQEFVRLTGGEEAAGETPSRRARLHYNDGLRVVVTVSQDPQTGRWVVTTAVPQENQSQEDQPEEDQQ